MEKCASYSSSVMSPRPTSSISIPSAILASVNVGSDLVDDVENGAVTAWSDTVGACCVCVATQIVRLIERILGVSRNSPGTGNRHRPHMNVVFAPVAQTVEDRSPRRVQRLPYHI